MNPCDGDYANKPHATTVCKSHILSCPYAWPHTWRPIVGMPIMLLRLMYILRLLYAIKCFRVMACLGFQLCWQMYKRPSSSLLLSNFLDSFVRESFLHSQNGFIDVHNGYYTATAYIHYIFFPSFQFNLILDFFFLSLNVEMIDFSWSLSFLALSFLGFFCLLFLCVLELLILLIIFLLFYCNYNMNNNNHN